MANTSKSLSGWGDKDTDIHTTSGGVLDAPHVVVDEVDVKLHHRGGKSGEIKLPVTTLDINSVEEAGRELRAPRSSRGKSAKLRQQQQTQQQQLQPQMMPSYYKRPAVTHATDGFAKADLHPGNSIQPARRGFAEKSLGSGSGQTVPAQSLQSRSRAGSAQGPFAKPFSAHVGPTIYGKQSRHGTAGSGGSRQGGSRNSGGKSNSADDDLSLGLVLTPGGLIRSDNGVRLEPTRPSTAGVAYSGMGGRKITSTLRVPISPNTATTQNSAAGAKDGGGVGGSDGTGSPLATRPHTAREARAKDNGKSATSHTDSYTRSAVRTDSHPHSSGALSARGGGGYSGGTRSSTRSQVSATDNHRRSTSVSKGILSAASAMVVATDGGDGGDGSSPPTYDFNYFDFDRPPAVTPSGRPMSSATSTVHSSVSSSRMANSPTQNKRGRTGNYIISSTDARGGVGQDSSHFNGDDNLDFDIADDCEDTTERDYRGSSHSGNSRPHTTSQPSRRRTAPPQQRPQQRPQRLWRPNEHAFRQEEISGLSKALSKSAVMAMRVRENVVLSPEMTPINSPQKNLVSPAAALARARARAHVDGSDDDDGDAGDPVVIDDNGSSESEMDIKERRQLQKHLAEEERLAREESELSSTTAVAVAMAESSLDASRNIDDFKAASAADQVRSSESWNLESIALARSIPIGGGVAGDVQRCTTKWTRDYMTNQKTWHSEQLLWEAKMREALRLFEAQEMQSKARGAAFCIGKKEGATSADVSKLQLSSKQNATTAHRAIIASDLLARWIHTASGGNETLQLILDQVLGGVFSEYKPDTAEGGARGSCLDVSQWGETWVHAVESMAAERDAMALRVREAEEGREKAIQATLAQYSGMIERVFGNNTKSLKFQFHAWVELIHRKRYYKWIIGRCRRRGHPTWIVFERWRSAHHIAKREYRERELDMLRADSRWEHEDRIRELETLCKEQEKKIAELEYTIEVGHKEIIKAKTEVLNMQQDALARGSKLARQKTYTTVKGSA